MELRGTMLKRSDIVERESLRCYKVVSPDAFTKLLKKSQALVDYVDSFVLKKDSDKIGDVEMVGQYDMNKMDLYGCLCYATGMLQTLVTALPKKKVPQYIKTEKQRASINVAIMEAPYLVEQVEHQQNKRKGAQSERDERLDKRCKKG